MSTNKNDLYTVIPPITMYKIIVTDCKCIYFQTNVPGKKIEAHEYISL